MPLVQTVSWTSALAEQELFLALRQVVPAAYTYTDDPDSWVTPGSIEFVPSTAQHSSYQSCPVLVFTEGYWRDSRDAEQIAGEIEWGLKTIFDHDIFAAWAKLENAGWKSPHEDAKFDGDLTMPAAIERALADIASLRAGKGLREILAG